MRKIVLIVHISLDGYVAAEDGSFQDFDQSPENLEFVNSITDRADAVLAGRISYEMLDRAWPKMRDQPNSTSSEIKYSNWYNASEKIVLSNSLDFQDNRVIVRDDIAGQIKDIKSNPGKDILLFGSPTAFKTLSALNLIDEYWIIVYPAIFGSGIPWRYDDGTKKLQLLETRQLSKGELALHYRVNN